MRIKTEDGFTLVELMITMVVFVLAMVAASNIFTSILTQFKQQSSIAASNIEGVTGLELMRHDIEQAGFGLFWNVSGPINYTEAVTGAKYDPFNATGAIAAISAHDYNDSGNAPRAVVIANNVLMNGSDVLVIKATNVATNAASQKWEYIVNNGALPNPPPGGGSTAEMLKTTDHAIIINPATGSNVSNQKVLMHTGGSYDVTLGDTHFSFISGNPTAFSPFEPQANSFYAYVAYGISETGTLGMPFNRADFYIKKPANAADMPSRCAPGTGGAQGTGILYKATVNHADGLLTELPLLDCVLDMQVIVAADTDSDGSPDQWYDNTNAFSTSSGQPASSWAKVTRDQVKEIRIYLVVQEGQKDFTYTSPPTITITDPNFGTVKTVNLNTVVGADYVNYRWKLQTLIITPYNLQ